MPLIGYYRGRDRTDNIFSQDYVLTDLPLGLNAGAAVTFSGSVLAADLIMDLQGQAGQVFFNVTAALDDANLPVNSMTGTPHIFFAWSSLAAEDVNLPLSLQGDT
mgnify:CR=1 FL=1